MKTPRRSRVVGISASVVAATLGCGFLAARGGDASDTLNVEVEDAFGENRRIVNEYLTAGLLRWCGSGVAPIV